MEKKTNTMIIRIVKTAGGMLHTDGGRGYVCIAQDGSMPYEGRVHSTRAKAIETLNASYDNPTWQGRMTRTGYKIVMD